MATLSIVSFVLWSTGLLTLALFGLLAYDARTQRTATRTPPALRVVARQTLRAERRALPTAA